MHAENLAVKLLSLTKYRSTVNANATLNTKVTSMNARLNAITKLNTGMTEFATQMTEFTTQMTNKMTTLTTQMTNKMTEMTTEMTEINAMTAPTQMSCSNLPTLPITITEAQIIKIMDYAT